MILPCDCKSEFQDQFYGKGRRVHNVLKSPSARCTVCGKEKSITVREVKDAKKVK